MTNRIHAPSKLHKETKKLHYKLTLMRADKKIEQNAIAKQNMGILGKLWAWMQS